MPALASSEAEIEYDLGRKLFDSDPEKALDHMARALSQGLRELDLFVDLSVLLIKYRKFEESWKICELGLKFFKGNAALLGNQGVACAQLCAFEQALALFRRQAKLLEKSKRPYSNIGNMLRCLGEVDEAISVYKTGLQYDDSAQFNLASALLLKGNLRDGFREFEGRITLKNDSIPGLPFWNGTDAPPSLLLYCEQGVGDAIQCARYIGELNRRGIEPVFGIPASIHRLFSGLPGRYTIGRDRESASSSASQAAIFSLPHLLETDLESIPEPIPFSIPEDLKAHWHSKLRPASGLRVALVWAGNPEHANDHNRTIPLDLFRGLLDRQNGTFISVQMGAPSSQIVELGLQSRVQDLSPLITNFADTAAILSHVDLLISVDTSVAHLAGNQGVPVWTLISYAPDWRWMLNRDDSPWYPSMRLFRQPKPRDWASVISRVAEALDGLCKAAESAAVNPQIASNALVTAWGETDIARWSNSENLLSSWNARAEMAAQFVPAGATVLDLGCGAMALERFLPSGCTYLPCDVVARDHRTLVCNLNDQPVPDIPEVTQVSMLGVLEYIHDWRGLLKQLRSLNRPVVLSYCPSDFTSHLDRPGLGWVNHLRLEEFCLGLTEAGFSIQSSLRVDSNQMLMRITPEIRRLPITKRVLVLSYNNVGNFGDRLGFHLVQGLIPPGAEVVYRHFRPWDVPQEHFDLLILGIGNSIFEPILTPELVELARRVPRSIGIFGTQYRTHINTRRLSELIDSLTIWFARHEEDVLLYGRGKANIIHLGDWLISAFPRTPWTKDETLKVGQEIWNDLPLDRTIQQIQQFRHVHSERIHPLLCALSSAEHVAYSEQRDASSGLESGKFRGMLFDIFGRTFAENDWFDVNQDAVNNYRARVMRTMSAMPQLFVELLS